MACERMQRLACWNLAYRSVTDTWMLPHSTFVLKGKKRSGGGGHHPASWVRHGGVRRHNLSVGHIESSHTSVRHARLRGERVPHRARYLADGAIGQALSPGAGTDCRPIGAVECTGQPTDALDVVAPRNPVSGSFGKR